MIPQWVKRYTVVPFSDHGSSMEGCSCYGLGKLVAGEQFGISMPDYDHEYSTVEDYKRLNEIISREITAKWSKVDSAKSGDMVLFKIGGAFCHIGVMLDGHYFLHITKRGYARWDDLDSKMWNRRIAGFYRYNG